METFDLMLRAATFALAIAAAAAVVRSGYPAAVIGGIGAFMVASAPGVYAALGPGAFFFNAWCIATPTFVWMLALVLFRDERPGVPHFALAGTLVALTVAGDYGRFALGPLATHPELARTIFITGRAAAVGLLAIACWHAAVHWRVDLVEQRRRARAVFVVVIGCVFAAFASSEMVFGGRGAPLQALVAGHSFLFLLAFALLQFVAHGGMQELMAASAVRTAPVPLAVVRADSAEAALARRVAEAMAAGELWKREGLGIGTLARELGTQEYLLRRAINRHLGYRNFNDFLHDYRLREAARRLADRREAHLPVLTIGLDCGYGSIGPFNRAFKARFGVTPSRYRAVEAADFGIGAMSR